MSRESTITADQVNAIADTIKASGGKPTSRMVRERLGTGSMGTVNRLLQQWKAGNTRQTTATLALPVPLQNSILDFMDQELTAARATLETELAEQQQEAADLATENERQVETIEVLTEQLTALSADKASAEGKAAQLSVDLDAAHAEVLAERQAAEHARTELAKAILRLEAMPRLEKDLEAARVDLQQERTQRTNAERQAAVLAAQKDDLLSRLSAADAEITRIRKACEVEMTRTRDEAGRRIEDARTDAAKFADQAQALQQRVEAIAGELSTAHAEAKNAARRVEDARAEAARFADQAHNLQHRLEAMTGELSTAHADAKNAAREAAELKGRLSVIQGVEPVAPGTASEAKSTKQSRPKKAD